MERSPRRRTPQLWTGLVLIAVCWPLNWTLSGLRTTFLFFPLWLGYVLAVDGLVLARTDTSPLRRSPRQFVLLFLLSAPAWWLFEVINWRTENWEYLGRAAFNDVEYFILASISFSTVMPAVFETAELAKSFRWMQRFAAGPIIQPSRGALFRCFSFGVAALTLTMLWPKYCYPLVWVSLFMLLEPINAALGRATLFDFWKAGDWRPVIALSTGALICGFFWELWNFYSFPKWIYHTPGVEFLYVFEMPLLGYLGYLPFALELFALRSLLWPNGPRDV